MEEADLVIIGAGKCIQLFVVRHVIEDESSSGKPAALFFLDRQSVELTKWDSRLGRYSCSQDLSPASAFEVSSHPRLKSVSGWDMGYGAPLSRPQDE